MKISNALLTGLRLSLLLALTSGCGKTPNPGEPGGATPGGADQAAVSCQDGTLGAHFEDVARCFDEVKAEHDRKHPGDSAQKALLLMGGQVAAKYPNMSVDALGSCCKSPSKQSYGLCQAFSSEVRK